MTLDVTKESGLAGAPGLSQSSLLSYSRAIPGDPGRGNFFAAIGVVSLGVLVFVILGGFLSQPSRSSFGIPELVVACGLLLFAADFSLAVGRFDSKPRTIMFSPMGISGEMIPFGISRIENGQVVFRSPILRLPYARIPVGGLPWPRAQLVCSLQRADTASGVSFRVIMQPYGKSGTGAGWAFARLPRFALSDGQFGRLVEQVAPMGTIVKLQAPYQKSARKLVTSYGHISGNWLYLAKNTDAAAVSSILRSYAA
jgi:hypothetical protein